METFTDGGSSLLRADDVESEVGFPTLSAALAIHKVPRIANPKTRSATPKLLRREPAR